MKKDCRKYDDWKKENPIWKTGSRSRRMISCYNFGKEGHISRGERRSNGPRDNSGSGGGQMAEMAKSLTAIQEVLKKLSPDIVFPLGVPTTGSWQLQERQKIIM